MVVPKGLWAVLGGVRVRRDREELALVAVAIQVHMPRVAREREVVEFMASRFGWPADRTRRRLEELVDLGVLRGGRDLADGWTRIFEVVDRPSVPAPAAIEMAA